MLEANTPIRILHVDDSEFDRELVRIHLQRKDKYLFILEAESVCQAREILALEHVDLVLSDYQMPQEDGMVLLKHLNENHIDLPFIFLTGQGNESIAAEALRLGADDYFSKDSDFAQYERLVNSVRRSVDANRQEQFRRRSDLLFRSTFEQVAVGMAHASMEGIYTLVNDRLCEIMGRSQEELLASNWKDVTDPDDHERESLLLRKLQEGELQKCVLQKRYIRPDGKKVWVNLTLSVAFLPDGERFIVAVMEDISGSKQMQTTLKTRENQYRELVEGTQDLVVIVDQQGKYLFANHASILMLGAGPEEVIGTSAWDYVHPEDLAQTQSAFTEWLASDEPSVSFENRLVSRSGDVHRVFWNISAHRDAEGRMAGLNGIARDLTPLFNAYDQVAHVSRLRLMIGEINQAIVRSKSQEELFGAIIRIFERRGSFGIALIGMRDENTGRMARYTTSPEGASFLRKTGTEIMQDPDSNELLAWVLEHDEAHYTDTLADEKRIPAAVRQTCSLFGLHSSAILPLHVNDAVCGALLLFSFMPDHFTPDEKQLLTEISEDISFALTSLRVDEERRRILTELEDSRRMLLESQRLGGVGNFRWDSTAKRMYWSEPLHFIFGTDPLAFSPTVEAVMAMVHEEDRERCAQAVTEMVASPGSHHYNLRICRADGAIRHLHVRLHVFHNAANRAEMIVGTVLDVSERKEFESKLEHERAFMEGILGHLPVGVAVHSLDGKSIQYLNRRMGELIGRTDLDSLDSSAFLGAIAPDPGESDRIRKQFATDIASGEPGKMIWENLRVHAGTPRERILTAQAVPVPELQLLVAIVWDSTEISRFQEKLKRQDQYLQQVIDASPMHMFVKKPDGSYLFINQAMRRELGIGDIDVAGKTLSEILPSASMDVISMAGQDQEVIRDRKAIYYSGVPRIDAQGAEHIMFVAKTPVINDSGEIELIVGNSIEITDLIRPGQEATLKSEMLAASNAELEAFAYQVSHDLRTPLRHIHGYVSLLKEDAETVWSRSGRIFINTIHDSALRMNSIIESLLRLARPAQHEIMGTRVDLSALARDICAELAATQPQRVVETVIQEGISTTGDAELLRIVLDNLLGNAWKFTARTASARIEFSIVCESDGTVYRVSDNGAGFDMNQADRLFKPFNRFHTSEEFEGTGIGLSTVQRIIQRHGGTIWAESTLGVGSTFFFTLGNRSMG